MGRVTELPAERQPRKITSKQREAFEEWFAQEFQDAKSGRRDWDREQRRARRLYEGVPKIKERNFPVKKGPNIVVPLAGTATDNVYSAIIDLIFSTQPIITCRPTQGIYEDAVRALQRWVDHSVEVRWKMTPAVESVAHDTCMGGTGFYYVPFETRTRKSKFHEIIESSPVIHAVPPEDVFEPAGSFGQIQDFEWMAIRHWMTDYQFADRAELEKWTRSEMAEPTPRRIGDENKRSREVSAHTRSIGWRQQELYEVLEVWATFDIDGDGFGEDLYAIWDCTSERTLKLSYNRYDRKPLTVTNYQKRPHMLRGMGIPEALRELQDSSSEVATHTITNMLLANTRMWAGPPGLLREGEEIYPGKYLPTQNADQIQEFKLSDIYPSGLVTLQFLGLLASKRIGEPVLADKGSRFGNRTPGITALTQVQQENQRFAAAFKSFRDGTGEAAKQCLWREQEQLLRGNMRLQDDMIRVLGEADAKLVIRLLRDENFDEQVAVEVTAGSPSVNREADKQNAVILLDRMFSYYTQALQLAQLNESLPEGTTKQMTRDVLEGANKFLVKMLQTFDQVRDPLSYIVSLKEAQLNAQGLPDQGGGGQDIVAAVQRLLGGAQAGASEPGAGIAIEAP